jgi:sugar lactone lactonase YvrE
MNGRGTRTLAACTIVALACGSLPPDAGAQDGVIGFDSDRWIKSNAQVVEHMGRQSLVGFAYLDGVAFTNGVIEVDVSVPDRDARSYPGIVFRVQSERDYERLYLRPHRTPLYPDAIQYTPVMNGIAGWQLYSGEGFTAAALIESGEWIHLRLEVDGERARLFMGDGGDPALVIDHLRHGTSTGSVGVMGPTDGTAFFSNFTYREDDGLALDPVPRPAMPPGTIADWEVSQAFPMGGVDLEAPPGEQQGLGIEWTPIRADETGLVDVARRAARTGREPDCVFVRTTLEGAAGEVVRLEFGYSDAVSIFLNGELLFTGSSAYTQRDPSFLGIIGYFDAVYLPLREGDNTLSLIVTESFGGWGFMCRDGNAVYMADGMSEAWGVGGFLTPESVVHDAGRGVLYVSNFDGYGRAGPPGSQYVSRVALSGEVLDARWITGLAMPTGMAVHGSTLYVVERGGLAVIDIDSGEIVERHSIPGAGFLNDVAVADDGVVYVSDSSASVIYRLTEGTFDAWITGGDIASPNAVLVNGGALLVGNNGDRRLKSVDLATGSVAVVAEFPRGIIDGIREDGRGGYLVSHWEGRVYRVRPDGGIERILDTTVLGPNCADFDLVVSERLLVAPTFRGDHVTAYRLPEDLVAP